MPRSAIISIRPFFVNAIFEGRKRFEFRRVSSSIETDDHLLIYASAPISAVVGEFRAGVVLRGPVAEVLTMVGSDDRSEQTMAYLAGAEICTAIEIVSLVRWKVVRAPRDISPNLRAPQSYAFLE